MNQFKFFTLLMAMVLAQSCSENDFHEKKNLDSDALKTVLNNDKNFSRLLVSTVSSFSELNANLEKLTKEERNTLNAISSKFSSPEDFIQNSSQDERNKFLKIAPTGLNALGEDFSSLVSALNEKYVFRQLDLLDIIHVEFVNFPRGNSAGRIMTNCGSICADYGMAMFYANIASGMESAITRASFLQAGCLYGCLNAQ